MTRNATAAATSGPPTTRRPVVRGLVVAAVVVGVAWCAAAPALAQLGEPVDPSDTTESEQTTTTTTAPSEEPSTTDAEGPTTTSPGEEVEPDDATVETDDDGTSIAALAAVGVVAFVLGLIVAAIPLGAALSRRKAGPTVPGPAPAPAAPAAGPAPSPPAGPGPAIGPAPSRDADQLRHQRVVLVEALIALRDQLPSAALGQEALQALEGAGITEVAPVGQRFDAGQHHAVHQEATDDPARHGTIVSVERPGYRDGATIIRQPEVVVATNGSPS
ncbi:nucleotide exchange factor GrpE [Iamia sp. SCSIO 61187]|uniref:nucleotide exchange factor GrpE n=1 Tax=Iamia sp. SCSIO 61187 TaxID=2722752 RepID=UPI001C632E99|nr:nucleotide exchange factor GrpE [Iamia sp. SCSIO 61187]QYG91104.1 nucleotide exchange factor GrpE [Iamia sp. SCSIO 61187]